MIVLRNIAAAAAVTSILLGGPALADENYATHDVESKMFMQVGQPILFHEPVVFQGEVITTETGNRGILAENGMLLQVPRMALVWNGDDEMFFQNAQLGDNIVVHLRAQEPYRIMKMDGEELALGSYDGVFYLSQEFLEDIDLDNLDNDIYSDSEERLYDEDLDDDDNDDLIFDTRKEEREALRN